VNEVYKQAIVVRTDLKMGKGKIATQVAHASLGAYRTAKSKRRYKNIVGFWEGVNEKKVVLKVGSLRRLKSLHDKAKRMRLPAVLIRDAGHTQVKPGTITCIGIGPAEEKRIDEITKDLKLL
jgi:PTH2 family peptidyl-tRNA hydrolase